MLVDDTGSTDTSYVDATATEGEVRYVYRVAALRGSTVSGQTDAAEATRR